MFTNPFNKKYQTGGSAPTDDQKKEMQGFVTWIKSNVEGFKDKSEQEIAKSLSDMAKSDEGKKSVQDLYSRYQKSKKQKSKFEDGGKFQSFICKHGRGGVNCGCGGMNVVRAAEGIDDIPTPKDSTVTDNGYVIYKPSVKEVAPNGESVIITYGHDPNGQWARRMEWTNGGTSILGGYNNNGQWVSEGNVTYGPTSEFAKAFLSPRARMSKYEDRPQSKEDGGVVKGQDGLSRKQVRQDKRKVLRAMNRSTAGAQYEDLINQTRNWDRFAGMSRLERKNAINQLILNGEKPIVQTPIQPDLGENYVINETTVPYQLSNPTPQVIETPKKACGSKIEKHQDDNGIIDHYRSKWSNDWNNIKRGWNNFKDSAFGLVVPTSGTDVALMAAGPMFKIVNTGSKAGKIIESVGDVGKKVVTKSGKSITIIPEGVHGSEKAAKRALTESAPFISQKGELANEAARNINGLRKWLYGGYYNLTTNLPK